MNIRGIYRSFAVAGAAAVLCVGAFGQGKHGGGNGNGHGNGNGGGRGQEMRQQRGNDDHGNRGNGNGNGWGRQRGGDDGGQQRAMQQQMRQQQEWNRGQQRQQEQWARQQQRQQEQAARQQQRQNEWNVRRQRDQYEVQQRASRRQYEEQRAYQRQAYQPQWQDRRGDESRGNNGKHLGWYKNGKAYTDDGRPYASTRDWRYEENSRDDRRDRVRNSYNYNYYGYSEPRARYYSSYQQPYYYQRSGSTRESFVRSLIGSFFAPQANYYQPYQSYAPYRSYQAYTPYYGGYQTPYYQATTYSPSYGYAAYSPSYGYDPGYGYGYDPYASYGYEPYYGTQMFGGGGLKSTLLNVGLSLLQGFLGNGYQQGLDQGEYVLEEYGRPVNNYYDPYAMADTGYYSPLASSFADQRQILQEGYRLGYRDAMRDADPYGNAIDSAPVNLVSQFLANTLVSRI